MENQRGFSLIELVVASAMGMVVSLGIAQIIISQSKQVSYLEDRMSRGTLEGELKLFISSSSFCNKNLKGIKYNKKNILDGNLLNNLGKPWLTEGTKYDNLNINKIEFKNIDVSAANTKGKMKLAIELTSRDKRDFKPFEYDINIEIDSSNEISSCAADGSTGDDENYPFKKKKCFTHPGTYTWTAPKDTLIHAYAVGAGGAKENGSDGTCYGTSGSEDFCVRKFSSPTKIKVVVGAFNKKTWSINGHSSASDFLRVAGGLDALYRGGGGHYNCSLFTLKAKKAPKPYKSSHCKYIPFAVNDSSVSSGKAAHGSKSPPQNGSVCFRY